MFTLHSNIQLVFVYYRYIVFCGFFELITREILLHISANNLIICEFRYDIHICSSECFNMHYSKSPAMFHSKLKFSQVRGILDEPLLLVLDLVPGPALEHGRVRVKGPRSALVLLVKIEYVYMNRIFRYLN